MATIDGNSFNLTSVTFTTTSRTLKSGAASGDSNLVTQSGYDGLSIQLSGFATSVSEYDSAIAAFMAAGGHILVIRTGWQYTVYGAVHNITESEGIPDNFFPFTIRVVTADPYQYSVTETTRTKTITGSGLEWSADDDTEDIITSGTVAAKPDIELVAAGSESATILKQQNKFS